MASLVDKARFDGQEQMTPRAAQQLRRHEIVPTLTDNLQGGLRSLTSKQSSVISASTEESKDAPSPDRGTATETNSQRTQQHGPTADAKGAMGYGTLSLRSLGLWKAS